MKSLPLTNKTSRAALLLAALVIVLLFGWWMVGRADREMRTELLQSSVTVAQTVGIDIDASAWKWTVAAKVALPMGMLLLLLIGATAAFISTRSVDSSPKPVLRRLMPPLAVIVILLMVGGGWLIYREHELMLSKETANDKAEVAADLRIVLEQQAAGLAAAAQSIAVSPGVQEALLEKDAASLLATWQPMFETLRRENHITHLYFFDASRTCLLRVHNPEKRGDRIDRFTAMEAERTGKTATGIELGPLGTFTLRVVRPVFKGGALVGYVELGKEIEDALQVLHSRSGNHLAVVIDKNHLSRQSWENGMRMLARDADWDRLRHNAIIYANQGRLPDAFVAWADQSPAEHASQQDREISFAGKSWRVSASPLIDAPGNEVGDLLIMRDVTASKSAFARELTLGGRSAP